MLRSGLLRLNKWAGTEGWNLIKEEKRQALLASWHSLLDNLNPDFRVAAVRKLKGKGEEA